MMRILIISMFVFGSLLSYSQDFNVTAPYTSPSRTTCAAANNCGLVATEDHQYAVVIPTAGSWTFSLCGSGFDTRLLVGTTLCSQNIGNNDDACGLQSEITATIAAGTFHVTVEGFATCGTYILTISQNLPAGPEDLCAGAQPIGCGATVSGTTVGYGADSPPFCGTGNGTGGGRWYVHTGTGNPVTASLCGSSYDTRIRVYSGTCVTLNCVAGNDDFCGAQSEVTFNTIAGTNYYILVHGWLTYQGAYTLTLTCLTPPGPEDDCIGALTIGCGGSASGSTIGYGADTAPACTAGNGTGGGVWYQFTGTGDMITASLCGSTFDTQIRVYTGTCGALVCEVGNDQSCGNQSEVSFLSTSGTTYYILVHGWGTAQGSYTLNITCTGPPEPACLQLDPIPYSAYPYAGTAVTLTDDLHSGVVGIGFSFCFMGNTYTQCVISSNNYITFNLANANTFSTWDTQPVPLAALDDIRSSVLGPWQDIDPAVGGNIYYQTLGTAPDRMFIVSYDAIPMFSCNSQIYTSQIVLHEGSNCIETQIASKPVCSTWNEGQAVYATQDVQGIVTNIYPGRNNTAWIALGEGTVWTPSCGSCETPTSEDCRQTILPIELLEFTGKAVEQSILLEWSSATEINNDFFTIERSSDGATFFPIAEIEGGGNSSHILEYLHYDTEPLNGTNYYRLRQTDYDGATEVFHTIAIDHETQQVFSLYPNPGSSKVRIVTSLVEESTIEVVIRDAHGVEMRRESFSSDNMIFDVSSLPTGVYVVELRSPSITEMTLFSKY